MVVEKELVRFLQNNSEIMESCNNNLFVGDPPEDTGEPYIVVQPIDEGRVSELGVYFCKTQLSLMGNNQCELLDIADLIIGLLDRYRGKLDTMHTDNMRVERGIPIKEESGIWLCPVTVQFILIEEK